MFEIHYISTMIAISILWIILRAIVWKKQGQIDWKREAQLLLVYICIVVVVRFTFFPFFKVDGQVQPLHFDATKIIPFWINIVPLVHLFDYAILKDVLINVIGNTTMFIPLGIVWPSVYKKLDTHLKVIAAGVGFSFCIEILQLLFYERASDIDDLILNSAGYIIGYLIYLLVKKLKILSKKKR